MAAQQHGENQSASSDAEDTHQEPPGAEEEYARRAEERFIDDLIARGEAVPEGEELPPGATHVVIYGEDGKRTVRRVRFSGHQPPANQ